MCADTLCKVISYLSILTPAFGNRKVVKLIYQSVVKSLIIEIKKYIEKTKNLSKFNE